MNINFEFIRRICHIQKEISNDTIKSKADEFSNSHHNKTPGLFKNFLAGDSSQSIMARYGVNCYCPDGEFKSYGSTLKAGHIYAMLMSPQECVNCQKISMVFSNFVHGLVPSTSGSLFGHGEIDLSTALVKEFERLNRRNERKNRKEEIKDSRMLAKKMVDGDTND